MSGVAGELTAQLQELEDGDETQAQPEREQGSHLCSKSHPGERLLGAKHDIIVLKMYMQAVLKVYKIPPGRATAWKNITIKNDSDLAMTLTKMFRLC